MYKTGPLWLFRLRLRAVNVSYDLRKHWLLFLAVLVLSVLGFAAEQKYYVKATHLGPGAVAVSCLNGGDPTVRGNVGGALIVSCGVR